MTTQQDARERAWREFCESYTEAVLQGKLAERPNEWDWAFNAAWRARGLEDEQRIAALVEDIAWTLADPTGIAREMRAVHPDDDRKPTQRFYEQARAVLAVVSRALAGQTGAS